MKILVVGGYGAMGHAIVRDLVESPGVREVVIAGRSLKKAQEFAKHLRSKKAAPAEVDATDSEALVKLMKDADVVINATWYEYNLIVMKAAIDAGIHYVDLGGLYHYTLKQLKLDEEARRAGIIAILGMGSSPGITNVMAGYGANKLEKIQKVEIRTGSAIVGGKSSAFQAPYSIRTIIDEFTLPPIVLREGRIKELSPMFHKEEFWFPSPIGKVAGYCTTHSELATLPKTLGKGVKDMDFAVAFPEEFTSVMETLAKLGLTGRGPINVKGAKVVPYEFLASALAASGSSSEVEDVDALRVDLCGKSSGKKVKLRYECMVSSHKRWKLDAGAVDTGVPPSIAAQFIAKGEIESKGVLPPESCIPALPFFKECAARDRGIKVYETSEETTPLF